MLFQQQEQKPIKPQLYLSKTTTHITAKGIQEPLTKIFTGVTHKIVEQIL